MIRLHLFVCFFVFLFSVYFFKMHFFRLNFIMLILLKAFSVCIVSDKADHS